MKISGAIFDMDGTILDSMHVWEGIAIRHFAERIGVKLKDDFELKAKSFAIVDLVKHLEDEYGYTCTAQQLMDGLFSSAGELYKTEVFPKPGIIDILEDFQKRGIKMCLATATEAFVAKPTLERLDMFKYFSGLLTCPMVGAGKHKPTIYEEALKVLGTPKSETLVFEDALYAIKTAKAAGFPVAGIYDRHYEADQNEIAELSDIYIKDFRNGLGL